MSETTLTLDVLERGRLARAIRAGELGDEPVMLDTLRALMGARFAGR